jgi:alkaline phosphatase D
MLIRTRRDFLKASALTVGSFVISTGLGGCNTDDSDNLPVSFDHGVASGDPLNDRVILWTRVTPSAPLTDFSVTYEVATDPEFGTLVRPAESARVSNAGDYTLKVDFQGLNAGTVYYYRFRVGDVVSPTGRTKTLPERTSRVKMAVFSCSNYPKGYFNAFTEAALDEELDVTLHLGDYIYEYGMFASDGVTPGYATENAVAIGRALPEDNNTELLELSDYRKRYALYRTDSGTQAMHAAVAMIAVWDDHEIANDAYKTGAENHDADEGDFETRKLAALQAYFEWIPIRPYSEGDTETIYRSFDFGDLVSLHMLDTRIHGRDKQLSYGDYPEMLASGDSTNFLADLTDTDRTIMGPDQMSWLQTQMSNSTATWQVIGQQVLIGRMNLPAELLVLISQLDSADNDAESVLLAQLTTSLTELATIKTRLLAGDPTLTAEETARLATALPYNLDAWDGYYVDRETLLGTAASLDKNLVVLSGDTHNGWANNLRTHGGVQVGVEFATTSVTSPGMEEYVSLADDAAAQSFESVITLLIDDLLYFNANNRGYMTVTYTADEAVAEWIYVDNIDSTEYSVLSDRARTLKTTTTTRALSEV